MRLFFLDEDRLRFLSKEGVDCVYNFKKRVIETYCYIDKAYQKQGFLHYYLQKERNTVYDCSKRLLYCSNEYRMAQATKNVQVDERLKVVYNEVNMAIANMFRG